MKDFNEIGAEIPEEVAKETAETVNETDKDAQENSEVVGYSSDHYKWEMAKAIESGNKIWLEHAQANYAKAKADGR